MGEEIVSGERWLQDLATRFEAASKAYAQAHGVTRDPDWFVLKMQEELGELTQVWNLLSGRGRPRGRSPEALRQTLADETADLLGHVLLFARYHDLDLASAVARKWRFEINASNAGGAADGQSAGAARDDLA